MSKIVYRPKVLIIDDEPDLVDILRDAFSAELSCRVQGLSDPTKIAEDPALHEYDLVLTDFRMPRLNGEAVVAEFRRLQLWTPIILMTGMTEIESIRGALRFGIADIWLKPLSVDEMIARGRAHLNSVDVMQRIPPPVTKVLKDLKVLELVYRTLQADQLSSGLISSKR